MAASGTINLSAIAKEVVAAQGGQDAIEIIHSFANFMSLNLSFGGGSTPTWVTPWSGQVALSGGAGTIDLTALPRDPQLEDVTFSGLKVVGAIFGGHPSNGNPIRIEGAASNGYELFGDADTEIQVPAGKAVLLFDTVSATLATVSGSAKDITLTSVGSEILYAWMIAGA